MPWLASAVFAVRAIASSCPSGSVCVCVCLRSAVCTGCARVWHRDRTRVGCSWIGRKQDRTGSGVSAAGEGGGDEWQIRTTSTTDFESNRWSPIQVRASRGALPAATTTRTCCIRVRPRVRPASAASMHMCTLDLQKRTVHHNRKNRVYLVNLLIDKLIATDFFIISIIVSDCSRSMMDHA